MARAPELFVSRRGSHSSPDRPIGPVSSLYARAVAVALAIASLALLATPPVVAGAADPFRGRQWGLDNIHARRAWATTRGKGAVIAIVDTGVDLGHPDLVGRITGPGRDFVEPGGDDGAQDENGHGTHVAGIAAATSGNGIGVAGVAPRARILPVRVLDEEGSGSTQDVADGIRWAANRGADVINLSLGASGVGSVVGLVGGSGPIESAVELASSKGAVVIAAAGNDAFPFCGQPSGAEVVCVGATDRNDELASYSNSDLISGSNFVVAPGGSGTGCAGDIFSTYLRTETDDCSAKRGYAALAGTSMATPFVSGIAALLASSGMANHGIVDCLLRTADDLGPEGGDSSYGQGRVNAARAVREC